MRSFGLVDINGNTYGFSRVIVYGADGKIKFAGGGGGGVASVTATSPITSSGGANPNISTSMNTNRLIGRSTAGVGVMEEITIGTGLVLTAGTLTNTDTGSSVTLTSAGGTETLVNDGTGPTLATKGLTAGTGISLTGAVTSVTITNAAPDQTVVLTAGTGIGVAGVYPNFTISNTDTGSGVTLTSAGGTETLVNDGTGPSLATKGLTAGTGITLTGAATSVTIANSGVTSVSATAPITSSGGATPTISTSMNTSRLIGRTTAGVGVMEEITVGTGLSLSAGSLTNSRSDKCILDSGYTTSAGVAAGATNYASLFGASQVISGNNINNRTPIPYDGTLEKFYLITTGSQPASGSCVVTVRDGGVDTAITITIAAGSLGGVFSDTVNTAAVVAGDLIDVKIVNNATATSIVFRSFVIGFIFS